MITRNCKTCGKEFTTPYNAKVYCSDRCARIANKKPTRAKMTECACSWCGKKFLYDRKKKYCCKACRLYANNRLKIARNKAEKPKNFMSIEEVARASREMNMSAGEYMVKYCYGKEGVSGGI